MEGIGLNALELVSGEAEQQADNIHRDIALCHIIYPVSGESDKCELEQYNSSACGSLLLVLLVFRRGCCRFELSVSVELRESLCLLLQAERGQRVADKSLEGEADYRDAVNAPKVETIIGLILHLSPH